MSVLVTARIYGNTEVFQKALAERADDFADVSAQGRTAGAIHHRFGLGDGFVVVVDEWESAEHFEKFFGAAEVQSFIASVGADLSVPPEIVVTEALSTPDQF
jgi:hypothetical protein